VLSTEAQSALRRIRSDIDDHWIQKCYSDGQGNYCLVGFVIRETEAELDEPNLDLQHELYNTLHKLATKEGESGIVEWNDKWFRTKKQVKELLDRALAQGGGDAKGGEPHVPVAQELAGSVGEA